MILDVHVDIVDGKKRKVLCDIAKGAENAGFKVNFVSSPLINSDNYSLLWRYPNKGEYYLENIIKQKDSSKLFFVNSNYFKTYRKNNNQRSIFGNDYYRIMWKSIYDNDGIYPNKPSDLVDRFYSDHIFDIKPWKSGGDTIFLIPNKVGTFGRNGLNVQEWINRQIKSCHDAGYTKIVVKIHPNGGAISIPRQVQVEEGKILTAFKKHDAKFAILYNSGACTECLIEGIPIFVQGPNSPAREFSNMQNLSHIRYDVNREQYVKEAAKKMWHIQDIMNGLPWINLREKL